MIPYDDLVVALATWRVKQGLPGSTMSTPAPVAATPSAPASKSGPKTAPPKPAPAPVAAHTIDDHYDVDDAALLEEATYGDDELGGAFAQATGHDDATSVGSAPAPNDATLDEPMPRGGKKSGGKKQSSDW